MRCMTLAIAFTALGWIASSTEILADETPAIDISSTTSSRTSYIALAANQPVAEVTSPSDVAAPSSQPNNANPGNLRLVPEALSPQDFSMVHGYRPPLPFGPSAPSSMLQYLMCDPHSCPNIWQGYEAQRLAELAQKCTPHGGGCHGCGCGVGAGSHLHGSPCIDSPIRPRKVVNRYRPASPAGCSSCGSVGCDSLGGENGVGGCSACQAANKPADSGRLSEAPTPATIR
jgi:hypothetical protein